MNSFRAFRCLTVTSVSAHGCIHADTQVAVVVRFRLRSRCRSRLATEAVEVIRPFLLLNSPF